MKNFLKQNLLVMLVLMFGYCAFALASTYSRSGGTSQYVGGNKAIGPVVDADFNGLVSWLNTGNIDDTNLSVGGISANKIKNFVLTFTQMGVGNMLITSSSSAFSVTSSPAPIQVTNLSTTITTTGHTVVVRLEPAPFQYLLNGNQTYGSYVMAITSTLAANEDVLFFVNNGATTAHFDIAGENSGTEKVQLPCSSFSYTDNSLGAGTYTFSVKAAVRNNADILLVYNCRLVVKEEF